MMSELLVNCLQTEWREVHPLVDSLKSNIRIYLSEEGVGAESTCWGPKTHTKFTKEHELIFFNVDSLSVSLPAVRLLLQAEFNQVVQSSRVVFGAGALGSLCCGSASQTSSCDALADTRIHAGTGHFERPEVSEWVRGDVEETRMRPP